MSMNAIKPLNISSLHEFLALPKINGYNYEFIDGAVLMSPRPAIKHQQISGNLYFELRNHFKEKNCVPIQEIDLVLEDNNFVPDLMVICDDELKGNRYEKPPLIAIEIVSPSSASVDYFIKRHKYEQLGVKEYWIVSPEEQCIVILTFATNQQKRYCEENVTSFILPDLTISLKAIFT